MLNRTAWRIVGGTLAIAALLVICFETIRYLVIRSDEFEVVAQMKVSEPDGYIAATRYPASMSGYGGYNVVFSSDDLKKRGYVSSLSDTLIMSMKDISITQENSAASAQALLVKQGDCHIFAASNIAEPERHIDSLYGHYFGAETVPLKEGDRWEQIIFGKSRCFGFDSSLNPE